MIIALVALVVFGCGSDKSVFVAQTVSPTDTLKNFIEASKKKDVAAIKKTLSKGSLELAEKSAEMQNTTIEELFKRDNAEMLNEVPEISSEKIAGETASVEVKDRTGGFETIPLVKENGVWKLAFDKYQEAMMEKMRQEMKLPEPKNAQPDNADSSLPAGNKTKTDK